MRLREIFRFELAYQVRRVWTRLFFAGLLVFAFLVTRGGSLAEARKVVADSAGVEIEAPMNAWVQIGVFGPNEPGDELGAPLYMQIIASAPASRRSRSRCRASPPLPVSTRTTCSIGKSKVMTIISTR